MAGQAILHRPAGEPSQAWHVIGLRTYNNLLKQHVSGFAKRLNFIWQFGAHGDMSSTGHVITVVAIRSHIPIPETMPGYWPAANEPGEPSYAQFSHRTTVDWLIW